MEVTSISSFKNKEHRLETNQNIIQFQQALKSGASQRQAEKLTNWPRQNFSYWNQRLQRAELDPVVADFFLQQEGVEFLNRISLAAEFVISQLCGGGTGAIQTFYELTKLDQLIASSDGSVHQRLVRLENNLIEFGKQQASQASNNLPEKEINCAMDETFPSDICLVGMDTDSGFILVEKLDRKRDFDTWNKAMEEALSPYSPPTKGQASRQRWSKSPDIMRQRNPGGGTCPRSFSYPARDHQRDHASAEGSYKNGREQAGKGLCILSTEV